MTLDRSSYPLGRCVYLCICNNELDCVVYTYNAQWGSYREYCRRFPSIQINAAKLKKKYFCMSIALNLRKIT